MSMSSTKRIIELFAPEYVIVPTSESISLYNVDSQKNVFVITAFIITVFPLIVVVLRTP